MTVEEAIPLVGDFGRYQFFLFTYAGVMCLIDNTVTFGNVFYAAETDHWCRVLPAENCSSWPEFRDNCTDVKKSILLPPPEREESGYPYSNCLQWGPPDGYVFDPYTSLNLENSSASAVPCQDGWEYETSQYRTTTISDFNLVCDEKGLPSLAQSLYFAGFLVGSFACGSLSDWFGRKVAISVGLIFLVVGSVVTTFSVNIYMYMAFRFIAGFGNIGAYLSAYVLVLELVGQRYRTLVSLSLAIFPSCAYFVLALMAMYVRQWRRLCLISSLMTVTLFIPLPFVQESVRWLVSKERIGEAEAVIRKVAKINKKTLPDVLFSAQNTKGVAGTKGSRVRIPTEPPKERKEVALPPSAIDLFKTPNMAAKTLNMMFNWFVTSLVYYGLSQSTGDLGVDDYWAFFLSGAVEVPGKIYAIFGVEWFGRKWNLVVLELIGGIACLATIFIPAGIWSTVVAMMGKFCISTTYAILYLYTIELFPTPVRAVGLGMSSVGARVGGILSPLILQIEDAAVGLPYIVFGSSAILGGLLALFLPETRGRRLPQTLEEGEEMGKCKCMGGDADDQAVIELEDDVNADTDDVIAMTNPAFESKGTWTGDLN